MADYGIFDVDEANALLDSKFGSGSPASYDIGLLLTEPDTTGATFTEVAGSGYGRITYTNNVTNFPAAAARTKKNGTLIDFGTASGGDWGEDIYGIGFFVSGDLKCWAKFTNPQTIIDGQSFSLPINALVITA